MPVPTLAQGWFWLFTVICAGGGAYFGAYLKKKGENLATHEVLDRLLVELRVTTEATKSPEARISNELWVSQKGWELKRDVLMQWFRGVHEANEAARDAFLLIDMLPQELNAWDRRKEDRRTMLKKWQECYSHARSFGMDVWAVAGTELSGMEYSIGMQLMVMDAQIVNLTPGAATLKTAAVTIANARGALKELISDTLVLLRRELAIAVSSPTPKSNEPPANPTPD